MEMDVPSKFCPTRRELVGKIKFLNETDKTGGKFLNVGFDGNHRKIYRWQINSFRPTKRKPRLKGQKDKGLFDVSKFENLPKEIRDVFWNGMKKRLTFPARRSYVNTKAIGKVRCGQCANDWKIRRRKRFKALRLEELVSPMPCPDCQRKAVASRKV